MSSLAASEGAKKSAALSLPSDCTCRRTIDSPRLSGGEVPGVGLVGAPKLPVPNSMRPGPSEARPLPACQIPAPSPDRTATQRAFTWPAVDTPNTQPWYGE